MPKVPDAAPPHEDEDDTPEEQRLDRRYGPRDKIIPGMRRYIMQRDLRPGHTPPKDHSGLRVSQEQTLFIRRNLCDVLNADPDRDHEMHRSNVVRAFFDALEDLRNSDPEMWAEYLDGASGEAKLRKRFFDWMREGASNDWARRQRERKQRADELRAMQAEKDLAANKQLKLFSLQQDQRTVAQAGDMLRELTGGIPLTPTQVRRMLEKGLLKQHPWSQPDLRISISLKSINALLDNPATFYAAFPRLEAEEIPETSEPPKPRRQRAPKPVEPESLARPRTIRRKKS